MTNQEPEAGRAPTAAPAPAAPAPAAQPPAAPARAPRQPRGEAGPPARWPASLLITLVVLGVLAAGGAAGWWAATHYSPRYAPDLTVSVQNGPDGRPDGPTMPDVRGLGESDAKRVVADAGFAATITTRTRPSVARAGTVVDQEPAPGAALSGKVTLLIATAAVVPAVTGVDVQSAVRDLQAFGASIEIRRVYQPGAAVDTVLAVDPAVGQAIPTHVILTVAAPPAVAHLTDLPALDNACPAAAVQVNAVSYDQALQCTAAGARFVEVSYLLNRRATRFDAVIAQPDKDPLGRTVQYAVLGDGKVLSSGVLRYGDTRTISLSTTNVLRLTLRVVSDAANTGTRVVFADARITAGAADVAALKAAGR